MITSRSPCQLRFIVCQTSCNLRGLQGFCLPAEMSDDMGGEGATQFEDIEGGGLGEGEGVKDVSEQIESEDQLDEARKQGTVRAEFVFF